MATTHQAISLELNTDVAEWCPQHQFNDILAVGTYQLNEDTRLRDGILYLYQLEDADHLDSAHSAASSSLSLKQVGTTQLPGIFDLQWHPSTPHPLLAAALTDGSVATYQLEPASTTRRHPHLRQLSRTRPQEDASLAVCIDFQQADNNAGTYEFVTSFSCGSLETFQATSSAIASLQRWHAHDAEVWVAHYNKQHSNLIFSGGDDSTLKLWDTRTDLDQSVWMNRKSHTAGVCCIASSTLQPNIICTGSYDEHVRMWDVRNEAMPVMITALSSGGGGVWKLKWHPTKRDRVLAACMHNGFMVLGVDGDVNKMEVVEHYEHQRSLAYGCSWCRKTWKRRADDDVEKDIVATVSFYDRLLHVWSPES